MSSVAERETAAAQSAPPVIDVEAMLAPIPGDNPAGEPPSVLYDEIIEARSADNSQETGKGRKSTEWGKVLALTTGALTTRTKDLRVCAWMTEALVKLYGLAGLRDGLRVVRGLQASFWDKLYPPVEKNGDLDGRAKAIVALGNWSAAALRQVALTDEKAAGAAYTFNDWMLSSRNTDEGRQLADAWHNATKSTPLAFYETAHATIEECWAEFEALLGVMNERFGEHNQGSGQLRKTLEDVRGLIGALYEEKLDAVESPAEPAESGEVGGGESAEADGDAASEIETAPAPTATKIKTRQEAVRQLREVAAFFRQTEPQSPVSYLVERAVKWSGMPLETWLASVIKDDGVLSTLRETLGVDPEAGVDQGK
jgi:type VI secretion system protein ImpA